jgi:hypothetical protein
MVSIDAFLSSSFSLDAEIISVVALVISALRSSRFVSNTVPVLWRTQPSVAVVNTVASKRISADIQRAVSDVTSLRPPAT